MGEVAAENIMGIPAVYDERTNPTCVYIEPEAASVGLTEEQAKAAGIDYIVGKFPLSANGKSLILNGCLLYTSPGREGTGRPRPQLPHLPHPHGGDLRPHQRL